jgi:hypothetical protein
MTILDAESPKPEGDNEQGGYAVGVGVRNPHTGTIDTGAQRRNYRNELKESFLSLPIEARWIGLGVTVALIIAITVWAVFVRTTTVSAEVAGKTWKREIEVQKFQTLRQSDWSHPSDAYNITSDQEIRYYVQVVAYYTEEPYSCGTLKNPETCYRQEPVYRQQPVYGTKYYYDVDRWARDRWLTTTGEYDTPTWAAIPKTFANVATLGNEREGSTRKETYTVHVVCSDHKCDDTLNINLTKFLVITEGEHVTANKTVTGNVRSINF